MDRGKLLDFAKNDDERMLLSRLCDLARGAEQGRSVKATRFLNGHEVALALRALGGRGVCRASDASYSAFGGYDGAERQVIAFYPDFAPPVYPIHAVAVRGRDLDTLSHRDYLGAVLSLGLRRDAIGDIITDGGAGYILCLEEISAYIADQLNKIGGASVKTRLCALDEIPAPHRKYKEISATVSSLRLDAVISAGAGVSRGDAAELIKAGGVSVDWEQIDTVGHVLTEGRLISIKGVGRMSLARVAGETKKGRIAVVIEKFL
jgi:RNA-binding protein YlmH